MSVDILKRVDTLPRAAFGTKVEIGISVSRFTVRYYPEVNDTITDFVGKTMWKVVSEKLSRDITCEGEITNNTGVMAFALGTACAFANDKEHFGGAGLGTFFLEEATVTRERRGWASVVIKASAKPTL